MTKKQAQIFKDKCKVVGFVYDPSSGYECTEPGDQAGEYVPVEVADMLAEGLLRVSCRRTSHNDSTYFIESMAGESAGQYLAMRGKIELHPESNRRFRWR